MKFDPQKQHRQTIRLPGYDYTSAGMYFITICSHQKACLFGEIVKGEMCLNEIGQIVKDRWQRLPSHFPNLQLDAFVVMPNHIHGILNLTDLPRRGAALDPDLEIPTNHLCSNATPSDRLPEPGVTLGKQPLPESGVAFRGRSVHSLQDDLPNADRLSEPGMALGKQPLPEPGVAFGEESLHSVQNDLPNAAPLPPRLVAGSVGAIVLNFKSVTTRSCNRIRRSTGVSIWQRNYYEHIIRNEESLQRIRQYIQHNPLSWQQDQLHPDNPSKW